MSFPQAREVQARGRCAGARGPESPTKVGGLQSTVGVAIIVNK